MTSKFDFRVIRIIYCLFIDHHSLLFVHDNLIWQLLPQDILVSTLVLPLQND